MAQSLSVGWSAGILLAAIVAVILNAFYNGRIP